jgi:LacI family transcriptional regulator
MVTFPRIALLIDTSTSWGAWIVQGVVRYAERHGQWLFALAPHGKNEVLRLAEAGPVNGVIARVTNRGLADQIARSRLPAVNVSWLRYGVQSIPQCTADGLQAAGMAARFFLDRGYRHFAYYGPGGRPREAEDCPAEFGRLVATAGATFAARRAKPGQSWWRRCHELAGWLAARPRPLAVFTFDAVHGWLVTEACLLAGLRVPEEVAVLAGDHDELMASIAAPRLSTIDPAPRRVGYEAAELLHRLLLGERRPTAPVLVPPAGVVERRSTDSLAVEDETVAAAVRHIREHACEALRVGDVAAHVSVARRTLEVAFRGLLGRSPAAEIRRVRLEHARRLVAHGDLPLAEIARRCGFGHVESFTRAFRRAFGQPPAAYRRDALQG